ncbi:GPR/FUN34 family protein [Aspergillus floccosus]
MSSSTSPADSVEKYDINEISTTSPPLAHQQTGQSAHVDYAYPMAQLQPTETRLPAFGGEFQPGLYRSVKDREIANPAPLGLCAFALSTFVLGLIEMEVRGVTQPNILIGLAFAYGGLVQLLSGMWEMAVGNTFGATVLSSYGGFWISVGIIFTPGGFNIMSSLAEAGGGKPTMFYDSFALMLMGWFIFTTLMMMCTLKSTFAFFFLFFVVDLAILLLGIAYMHRDAHGMPNTTIRKAGGFFCLLGSFLAWYNAFAGLADTSNSFFIVPVLHFPWSEKGRESRRQRKASIESTAQA